MRYIQVLVYDMEGNFRGNAILKDGVDKLQGVNLWDDTNIVTQLARLNGDVAIKAHWPRQDDPEVQALLNNPDWEPYDTYLADVVDEDNSYYVFKKDDLGNDTEDLDEQASVIKTKKAMVPERPSDVTWRIRKALELVATRRSQ